MDTQDRQEKQDETLRHRKRTRSMIGSAPKGIQNLHQVSQRWCYCLSFVDFFFPLVSILVALHGPFRVFPTPWSSLRGLVSYPFTDTLAPFVEIFSPFRPLVETS